LGWQQTDAWLRRFYDRTGAFCHARVTFGSRLWNNHEAHLPIVPAKLPDSRQMPRCGMISPMVFPIHYKRITFFAFFQLKRFSLLAARAPHTFDTKSTADTAGTQLPEFHQAFRRAPIFRRTDL
jgi:hypothetical protein